MGDLNFGERENDPNRLILVRHYYVYRSFGTPKSGKGRRVDTSKQLRSVLMELRDDELLKTMQTGRASGMDDLVFHREDGNATYSTALYLRTSSPFTFLNISW